VVIEHLAKLVGFSTCVFLWNHNQRTLWSEFARVQEAAEIHLSCHEEHEHGRYCHLYGFHELRRTFATMNADKLTPCKLSCTTRVTRPRNASLTWLDRWTKQSPAYTFPRFSRRLIEG
jgi:hypothetical protein